MRVLRCPSPSHPLLWAKPFRGADGRISFDRARPSRWCAWKPGCNLRDGACPPSPRTRRSREQPCGSVCQPSGQHQRCSSPSAVRALSARLASPAGVSSSTCCAAGALRFRPVSCCLHSTTFRPNGFHRPREAWQASRKGGTLELASAITTWPSLRSNAASKADAPNKSKRWLWKDICATQAGHGT